MAFGTDQLGITTSAGKICDGSGTVGREEGSSKVWVHLPASATASVFIGGRNVTTGDGFELAAGQTVGPLQLGAGDSLFGVAASAQTVSFMQSRI